MKTLLRKGTLLAAALLLLLLSPAPLRAQYVLDLSSIDYFTTSGDIPVSLAGGQAEIEFGFYSGGPAASVLRSTVLQAVEDADCGHIITDASVTYTYGNYEGKLTLTVAANRQKFSGKEDQTTIAGSSLPYLDFGARMYDAKLVRWNTYDPMAEKYYGINPYVYCAGDPVSFVDPEGRYWYSYIDKHNKTQYCYVEGELDDDEVQKNGYTKKGYTFTDEETGTYYGLFGNTIRKDDKNDLERRVSQKIDDLLIKYYTYAGKYEDFYLGVPLGAFNFEYKGKSFSSDRKGTIFRSLDNHDNSYLTIGEMPSSQKKIRTGY